MGTKGGVGVVVEEEGRERGSVDAEEAAAMVAANEARRVGEGYTAAKEEDGRDVGGGGGGPVFSCCVSSGTTSPLRRSIGVGGIGPAPAPLFCVPVSRGGSDGPRRGRGWSARRFRPAGECGPAVGGEAEAVGADTASFCGGTPEEEEAEREARSEVAGPPSVAIPAPPFPPFPTFSPVRGRAFGPFVTPPLPFSFSDGSGGAAPAPTMGMVLPAEADGRRVVDGEDGATEVERAVLRERAEEECPLAVNGWGGGRCGVEEEDGTDTFGTGVGDTAAVVLPETDACEEALDGAVTLEDVLRTEVLRIAREEERKNVSFLLPTVPASAPRPCGTAEDGTEGEEEEGALVLLLLLLGCGIEEYRRRNTKECAGEGSTQ